MIQEKELEVKKDLNETPICALLYLVRSKKCRNGIAIERKAGSS